MEEGCYESRRARAAVRFDRLGQGAERALRRVRDRPDAAVQPAGGGEHAALHVDRVGTGALVQAAALLGRVGDPIEGEDRAGSRPGDAEPGALPQDGAVLGDDASGVDDRTDLDAVQPTGDAKGDEPPLGDVTRCADSDQGSAEAGAAGGARLGGTRAGCYRCGRWPTRCHPVRVHAMLLTVSFTLEVAA